MIAKRAFLAMAFVAALALVGRPAPAWAQHHGGGHHGGGHHGGGGHAVPRGGSPGHLPSHVPGSVGEARHPRAGTGTGGHYGYHHGGYYGGHYGHYYGGHYGYYPYGYASFYFGWPYSYAGWWPYAWGGYYDTGYYAPSPSYGYDTRMAPPPTEGGRYDDREPPERSDPAYVPNTGRVRLEVRPNDASVYVDDEFWGRAGETKLLTLRAGPHVIELVRPGFATARQEVEVVKGERRDVLVELERP